MQFDMVFEGGGAKGFVFVGAMDEFFRRDHTYGRLLGTSAGAITATLLAAGYTTAEMLAAMAETRAGKSVFTEFMGQPAPLNLDTLEKGTFGTLLQDIDLPLIPKSIENRLDAAILQWLAGNSTGQHLLSFVELGGWYSADAFLTWIADKLDSGTVNGKVRAFSSMTLEQFYAATQIDLSLVASNISKSMKLVLNHRTAPQVPVVWAVRMSMSIPLLWQEVTWPAAWGSYRGIDLTGDSIVDGGLISNFPIELFLSDEKPVVEVMGPKLQDNVLGLMIDDTLPVPNAPAIPTQTKASNKGGVNVSELAAVQRIMNLANTMMEANDKDVIAAFEDLVARLPAGGYGTTEFDMTEARRTALVEAGRQAMKAYLNRRETQTSISFAFETAPTPTELADQMALKMLRE